MNNNRIITQFSDYIKETHSVSGSPLRSKHYTARYKDDVIVFVSPKKILDRLAQDSPDFDIYNPENRIGNRLGKATDYLNKYLKNDKRIDILTGDRTNDTVVFEPSIASIYDGKLSFTDGRHRILAAYNLGIPEVAVEVPSDQESYFTSEFGADLKENYIGYKSIGSGSNIAFIKNIPDATANALSKWLDNNNIKYKRDISKTTSSQYFKFLISGIMFIVRVSNHTKPMANPKNENIGVNLTINGKFKTIEIDTSIGFGLKTIVDIIDTAEPTILDITWFLKKNPLDITYVNKYPSSETLYNKYINDGNLDKYQMVKTMLYNKYKELYESLNK